MVLESICILCRVHEDSSCASHYCEDQGNYEGENSFPIRHLPRINYYWHCNKFLNLLACYSDEPSENAEGIKIICASRDKPRNRNGYYIRPLPCYVKS